MCLFHWTDLDRWINGSALRSQRSDRHADLACFPKLAISHSASKSFRSCFNSLVRNVQIRSTFLPSISPLCHAPRGHDMKSKVSPSAVRRIHICRQKNAGRVEIRQFGRQTQTPRQNATSASYVVAATKLPETWLISFGI